MALALCAAGVSTAFAATTDSVSIYVRICDDPDADGVCSYADNCPNNYNPSQLDTDGDGDGDACDLDDDNDGMLDDWELLYPGCLSPLIADVQADCDEDGFTNLEEYEGETDPIDRLSIPLDTIYVDDDNLSGPWYGTAAFPFNTIADAMSAATHGDTVLVRDGVYAGEENKNLDFLGKAITLRSEGGPENCVIDCEGAGRAFYFHSGETSDSIVKGFTILNCSVADDGGAILCTLSSPSIVDCIITGNRAGRGGGLYLQYSSAVLKNCDVSGNSASTGGGLFCDSSSPTITHCTLTRNIADWAGGVEVYSSTMILVKSILWADATASGAAEIALENDSTLTVKYSDVQGGAGSIYREAGSALNWGSGNIDADPMFVSPGQWSGGVWTPGDNHLTSDSPCVEAGPETIILTQDIDGDPRPRWNRPDIGADEYYEVSLRLVPDSLEISQGDVLGYTVTAINHTSDVWPLLFFTTVTLPSGKTYPSSGFLVGPLALTIDPFDTMSQYVEHHIPSQAPLGSYRYNAFIHLYYPDSINEQYFNFEVLPSP
jgi:hypothetical protein